MFTEICLYEILEPEISLSCDVQMQNLDAEFSVHTHDEQAAGLLFTHDSICCSTKEHLAALIQSLLTSACKKNNNNSVILEEGKK